MEGTRPTALGASRPAPPGMGWHPVLSRHPPASATRLFRSPPPDRPTHVTTSLLPRHRTMTTRSVFGSSVLVPLAEGAETVPGGSCRRAWRTSRARMLGAGVAHACPTSTTDNTSASAIDKRRHRLRHATTSAPSRPVRPPRPCARERARPARAGRVFTDGAPARAFARADVRACERGARRRARTNGAGPAEPGG